MAPLLFSFLLLLFSINNLPKAQSYSNISLGTTFTPLPSSTTFTKWLSPSGDFAFGFRALHSNTSLFLLGVFYDKIPNKTLVWTANGASPVTYGSTAVLTPDGQLSLTDPTGQEIWNAAGATTSIFKAEIQDTGNFVLYDQSSTILFQTFQDVTDTILPGQSLPQGTVIYSRLMDDAYSPGISMDDAYSPGRFELILQTDANLVNYMVAYPTTYVYTDSPYWASGTPGTGNNTLVYDESSGSIYLSYANTSLNKGVLSAPNVDNVGNYYMRATMDPDGVFRQYTFPKNNPTTGSWVMQGGLSTDICDINYKTGSGPCGFNSYCTYEAADHRKPKCHCPENYILLDPTREYKGCIANFITQPCEPGGEIGFNFTAVNRLDWPLSDADQFNPMNVTDCTNNCLKDCFCMVAIYDNGTCWKKKFPLSSGRMNINVDRVAYIKYSTVNASPVPTSVLPGSVERKNDWTHRRNWVVAGACILVGSAILNLALVGAFFVYPRNKQASATSQSSRNIGGSTLCSFTYEDLEKATKGFSEEVGRGASGIVYKGVLPTQPGTLVAVKKLDKLSEESEKDFENELATIGQANHKNLVRLLGFCKEGDNRLMVFEFMSKGSLNKLVFGSDRPEWNRRVQIVLGIAGGLAYLHEECRTPIIHCDIKPQNILLNDKLEVRISDFGLAKLLRLNQTRTSTGIRGTIGYFAPEWFKNVAITSKVDVYSFGVMLLEIVCCRKNFDCGLDSMEKATVIEWAKECYKNGRLDLLVVGDEEAKMDGMRLERLVMVGISCVQEEPWLRPSMKKVVQMLEGSVGASIHHNIYSNPS